MNIGGGEAADQLVRMMLSGSEVAVRLSGSAIKNVLALTMALAKKHKTISGKVNLAKMLKETRDVRRFAMSPEQYQQFRQRAGKQKILFSAIRDSDNKGKVVDVIMPVTEIDRANMIFERIRYTGQPEQARQDVPSKEQEARVGQEAPQREQQRPQQGETPVTPPVGKRQEVASKKGSRSGQGLPATTFNFLVSLLYSQIFQTLYYCADQIHHGALPCHVHFILDEAPSVNLPGLPRELATMRSRNISCSTIIQNMAQIKELYKDSWETIPGNSDTLLYLGGNESSTHKYISEALGKSTIDTKTHGQTKGRSGSYSTNFQISGRELLTPDEVRMLDNRYCILFIRGTRPVMDEKYELMEHPAIRYTMDGGGPPYIHHGTAEPPIPGEPLFQTDFDNEKENAAA